MQEVIASSTDGRRRIVVEPDHDAQMPDGDVYGYVMRRFWESNRYVWRCESAPHGDTSGGALAERMTTAENNAATYGDQLKGACDAVERAMMRAGAVDWHDLRSYVDRSGDEWRVVVTRGHLAEWGVSEDDVDQPAKASAADWQAWLDGEVYGVALEELTTWTTNTVAGERTRDEWETVESVWGFYGADYVKAAAVETFGDQLEDGAES